MGLLPASSPLAHQASIELQELGKLLRTPVGMGMNGEDNACTSNDGLRSPVGLDEMEQELEPPREQAERDAREADDACGTSKVW